MNEEEKKNKQIKTFISYVNVQLEACERKISRLTDIHTGIDLFFLLKSLCEKYTKEFPILTELEIEDADKPEVGQKNIQSVLDWLEKNENFQFSGITAEGIFNKNEEQVNSLVWHIIIYFHFFSGGWKYQKDEEVPVDYGTYYDEIVEWVNDILVEITGDSNNEIKDLSDWKNGIALYTIIKTLFSSTNDDQEMEEEELDSFETNDPELLVHNCIEFATDRMGIPEVISIDEVLEPEEISIAIYLHYFRMLDELNQLDAAATSSDNEEEEDDDDERIFILRKSLEEERMIRSEMSEEHKRERERMEELMRERDEQIRSLTNSPNTSSLMNNNNLDTSLGNVSDVSMRSTASTRSTMKKEMEKLKIGFMSKKGDILDNYKRQLRRVMMSQYEEGRRRNEGEVKLMQSKLEEKELEIQKLRMQVVDAAAAAKEEKKKERKDAEIKIVEQKECCNIL